MALPPELREPPPSELPPRELPPREPPLPPELKLSRTVEPSSPAAGSSIFCMSALVDSSRTTDDGS